MNKLGIQSIDVPPDGIHLNRQCPVGHTRPIGSRDASKDHLMMGIPRSGSQHIDDKLLGAARLQIRYRVQNIRFRGFHSSSMKVWLMTSNHPNDVGGKSTWPRISGPGIGHPRCGGSSQLIQKETTLR